MNDKKDVEVKIERIKEGRRSLIIADLATPKARRALKSAGVSEKLVLDRDLLKGKRDVTKHVISHDAIRPITLVPERRLDLLIVSPDVNMSSWHIPRWATDLRTKVIFIEQPADFEKWGPDNDHLSAEEIRDSRGKYFKGFITALTHIGFNVEWKTLPVAYDGLRPKRRTIMIARSDGKPISWPRERRLAVV